MPRAAKAVSPAVEFTSVVIAGKTYDLSFSFNGLRAAERATGDNLLQGIGKVVLGGMSATQYCGVLFAALRLGHPDITLDDTGNILESAFLEQQLEEIREALLTTYRISFKRTEDPPVADPPAEKTSGN